MDNAVNPQKNIESKLHETIDKVTDKEVDMIAGLAKSSIKLLSQLLIVQHKLKTAIIVLLIKAGVAYRAIPLSVSA
ncbi:MAG: hypothetical protein DID92_2727744126 [Candidatus Nitrotoga sp. SPKER]|nr:MAG: hypothetical protein DID92_2727744126 [Candidatus Nitrotoga sp. SPKER]